MVSRAGVRVPPGARVLIAAKHRFERGFLKNQVAAT